MDVRDGSIAGLRIIRLKMLNDERGFFVERYHAPRFAEAGFPPFVQDNHSRSAPGVVRGLHYQHDHAQGKLVGVTSGRVLDVAVDVRPDSPTFGRHEAVELSGNNGVLLWMPAGFAHGFCVLGDEPADVVYKVTANYNQKGEGGIRFNDPRLAIPWPVKNLEASERDRRLPGWDEYCANPPQWGKA